MEFGTGNKASSVPRPRARQELRLALAMRGGVSLAVWIGGAVSEIERLRRAGAGSSGDPVYRSLLDLARYSTVAVDVLAGASAGGLNAAVYAAAQCHGFDIGKMRDLWTMLGDIETSSRATTSAGRAAENLGGIESEGQRNQRRKEALRPPSILDGDGYFYPVLASRLATFIAEGGTDHAPPVHQLSLVLSATLFEPREIRLLLNRHNKVTETGSEALFRFRKGPGQDDLAANGSAEQLAKRLAMAARATSSFPIAFEPADIPVGMNGQADPGPTRDAQPAGLPLAMREGLDYSRTFELPGGHPQGVVKVIDGGTLDNIPVTAAVRAIVDSAAEGLTDRWLLYLSPSPPDPTPDRPPGTDAGMGSPRAIATTLRSLKARFGVESLLADVHELEAVNRTTCQRRLTMAAAFGGLLPTDPVSRLTEAKDERTVELAAIWTELDVTAVTDALRRPQAGDALTAGLTVAPLAGWSDEHELGLRDALAAVLSTSGDAPWTSNSWLGQLARLLVSWARDLETRVSDADLDDTGRIKGRAYRLGTMVAALERAQRLRWLKAAQTRNPTVKGTTVEQWAKETWSEMLRRVPTPFAAQIPDVLTWTSTEAQVSSPTATVTPNPPDPLTTWVDELTDNLEQGGDQDLSQALWRAGCHVAQDLTELGARAPAPEAGTSAGGSEIFGLLDQLARPDDLQEGLRSAVTLCAPLALLGPAPDTEIRFTQLTGNAPTPLDRVFENLKQSRTKGRGKRKGNPLPEAPLRASDKLCGDELGNFAAFLSAKWRANDWMWGRLDAAATLVDNLLDPERLAELALAPGGQASFTASLDLLVDQIGQVPAGWDRLPAPPELDDLPGIPELRDRLAAGPGTDAAGWDQWVEAVRQIRDHVVLVLQWEILASELPVVADAEHDPPQPKKTRKNEPPPPPPPAPLNPVQAEAMVRDYDVGLQGLEDIGDQRRVRLFLRAALVAFGALRPDGPSGAAVAGRYAATMLKPLYLIAVFVAASARRGLFVAAIALGALQATYWRAEKSFHPPGWPSWTLAVLGIAAVVAVLPRPEKLARLVLAGTLAGVSLLFGLWSGGGAWASASLLAFGLAAATGVLWRGHRKTAREKGGKVSGGDQVMYASTILAALAGIVAGGLRTMCHSARCDDWRSFAVSFLVLGLAALLVAGTGTFWMNGKSRIVVLLLVVGAYAGTVAPFAREGWPGWVPVLSSVAAVATAAGLALLAALDSWRLDQACGRRSRSLRRLGRPPVIAGTLAYAVSLTRVPWPRGAWILLAVAAAGYSLTVLATYVDVLRPRPNRDEPVARVGSPTPARRKVGAAAPSPPPAEVPAPSVSGPPVARA